MINLGQRWLLAALRQVLFTSIISMMLLMISGGPRLDGGSFAGGEMLRTTCTGALLSSTPTTIIVPESSSMHLSCVGVRASLTVEVGDNTHLVFESWGQHEGSLVIEGADPSAPLHNVSITARSVNINVGNGHALSLVHGATVSDVRIDIDNSAINGDRAGAASFDIGGAVQQVALTITSSNITSAYRVGAIRAIPHAIVSNVTMIVRDSTLSAHSISSSVLVLAVGEGTVRVTNMRVEVFNSSVSAESTSASGCAVAVGLVSKGSTTAEILATNVTLLVAASTVTSTGERGTVAVGIATYNNNPGPSGIAAANVTIAAKDSNVTANGKLSTAAIGMSNYGAKVINAADTVLAAVSCRVSASGDHAVAVIGTANHGRYRGNGHDSRGKYRNVRIVSEGSVLFAKGCRYVAVATLASAHADIANVSIAVTATDARVDPNRASGGCGSANYDVAAIAAFFHDAPTAYSHVSLCVRDSVVNCKAYPTTCAAIRFQSASAVTALVGSSVLDTTIAAPAVGWLRTGATPNRASDFLLYNVSVFIPSVPTPLPTDTVFVGALNLSNADAAVAPMCEHGFEFPTMFLSSQVGADSADRDSTATVSTTATTSAVRSPTTSLRPTPTGHHRTDTVLPTSSGAVQQTDDEDDDGGPAGPTTATASESRSPAGSQTVAVAPPNAMISASRAITATAPLSDNQGSSTAVVRDLPKTSIVDPVVVQRTSEASRAVVVAAALAPLGVPPSAAAAPARMAAAAALARCGEVDEPALMEVPVPALAGAVGWHAMAQRVTVAGVALGLLVVAGCVLLGSGDAGKLAVTLGLGITFGPYAFLSPAIVERAGTVLSAAVHEPTVDGLVDVDRAAREPPPMELVVGAVLVALAQVGWCAVLARMARGGDRHAKSSEENTSSHSAAPDDPLTRPDRRTTGSSDDERLTARVSRRLRAEIVESTKPHFHGTPWLRNFVVVDFAAAIVFGTLSGLRGSSTVCVVRSVLAAAVSVALTVALTVYRPFNSHAENAFAVVIAALQTAAAAASTVSLVQRRGNAEAGAAMAGLAELLALLGLAAACLECVVLACTTMCTKNSKHDRERAATGSETSPNSWAAGPGGGGGAALGTGATSAAAPLLMASGGAAGQGNEDDGGGGRPLLQAPELVSTHHRAVPDNPLRRQAT